MAAFKSLLALVALLVAVGAGEHTERRARRSHRLCGQRAGLPLLPASSDSHIPAKFAVEGAECAVCTAYHRSRPSPPPPPPPFRGHPQAQLLG